MKFSAVISHPIQHFSPIFSELAKNPDVEVRVIYLCDHGQTSSFDAGFNQKFSWDVPLTDGHDHVILRAGFSPKTFGFLECDAPGVSQHLESFKPDVVWIHGYGQAISWRAVWWASKNATRSLYFGDSELLHKRSLFSRALKRLVLPYFFSKCDLFLTAGDNNEAYYSHYGVGKEKMIRGACPIDVKRFTFSTSERHLHRKQIRTSLNIPNDAFVLLFSGKLVDYKRPQDLVLALQHLPDRVHAVFIGSGPEESSIKSLASSSGVGTRAHVTGFLNQSIVPKYMCIGDVTVVSSERDAHPLVVAESLPYGLPIIASDKVGCVGPSDTARENENALVYPCGDILKLAGAIEKLFDSDLYNSLSTVSYEIAPSQDVATVANIIADLK